MSIYSDNYSLTKAEISKHKKKLEKTNYAYKGTANLFVKGHMFNCPESRSKLANRLDLYIVADPAVYLVFSMLGYLRDKGEDIYDKIANKVLHDKSAFKDRANRSVQPESDEEYIEFVIRWMGLSGLGLTQRQQVIYTLEKHIIEVNKIKDTINAKTNTCT